MTLRWRKSSYSGSSGGGTCVEVAWRKSSFSPDNGGNCVEVASASSAVAIRDSKDTTGPILSVPTSNWAAFLRSL